MTITVTPTVEASNVPPRVRLNVSASAGETSTVVTRLDPDGRRVPVRTSDGNPLALSGGVGLLYDYEPWFGYAVSYSSIESSATVSAQVTVPSSRVWLIHPGLPSLSMPIDLRVGSLDDELWDVEAGMHWPIGREFPVPRTGGTRRAPASSVTVAIESLTELEALRTVVRDAGVLLLNVPANLSLGIDPCYISVGSIRNKRVTNIGSDPYRAVELPYQEVDRPVGGSQALRTYVDVLADNSTYASLMTRYSSYFNLLAGP